jgi:hypothetical protein
VRPCRRPSIPGVQVRISRVCDEIGRGETISENPGLIATERKAIDVLGAGEKHAGGAGGAPDAGAEPTEGVAIIAVVEMGDGVASVADEYIAGERRGTISGGGDIGLSGATGAAGFEQSEVGGGQRGERR